MTDCYRFSDYGEPVVALKSYIMTPFSGRAIRRSGPSITLGKRARLSPRPTKDRPRLRHQSSPPLMAIQVRFSNDSRTLSATSCADAPASKPGTASRPSTMAETNSQTRS